VDARLYDRISDGMAYLDATRKGWVKHAIEELASEGGSDIRAYTAIFGSALLRLELIGEFGIMWATMNGYIGDSGGKFGLCVPPIELDRAWRRRIVARVGGR
jgi:hypothetical protein